MRHNRIPALFLASALTALAAAPAIAQTPYDGLWNVTIVTKTGSCEPSARSTLTVADGKISGAGADVSGSIGREGIVRVSINGAKNLASEMLAQRIKKTPRVTVLKRPTG